MTIKAPIEPSAQTGTVRSASQRAIARANRPGRNQLPVFDHGGASVERDGRADVRRDRQECGSEGNVLGLGGLDDEMFFAVDNRARLVQTEQSCPRAD